MKTRSKAARIIRHIAVNPRAKPDEVARATGSTKNSVYTIRHRYKAQIAAKRQELQQEKVDNVLDLSAYPVIKEHIPAEELKKVMAQEQGQSVDALVNERAEKYGKFENLAEVSQRFKDSLHYFLITRNKYLAPDQQEAMELIFHKFARIINGDADYIDNWKDIAGYATLVSDRLEGNAR